MGINNLPASLQSIIQLNYLERQWQDTLRADMGFRAVADREPFSIGIGETVTKTRPGLILPNTTPVPPAANADITSGITPSNYSVEQFTLGINQYAGSMLLNIVTSKVAIQEQFLLNAAQLGYSARLTLDLLAEQALFNGYMGGNTRVITTLSTVGPTIHVDDIRGFQFTFNSEGQQVPVSATNPVNVTVGGDVYSLTGAAADGTNISMAPGGSSGNLTCATNVTVADGTAGNSVVSAVAPVILRPSANNDPAVGVGNTSLITQNLFNNGRLSLQMLVWAAATLRANAVPAAENGYYMCYADPFHFTGIYNDPAFQQFFRGRPDSKEYRRGVISDALGLMIAETNINPIQASLGNGPIHRSIVCGKGALIEGEYTTEGYAGDLAGGDEDMITVVDGIAHVVREPLDALKQVVTQSYAYIGGFVAPTDMTANPQTIPTASNASLKRAVILETL
jgi:hypothetical protein